MLSSSQISAQTTYPISLWWLPYQTGFKSCHTSDLCINPIADMSSEYLSSSEVKNSYRPKGYVGLCGFRGVCCPSH